MTKPYKILPILLIIIIIFTTGCWDRIDIEERGYILGVAIDSYPPLPVGQETVKDEASYEEEKEMGLEVSPIHTGDPIYAMTIQLPVILKAKGLARGSSSAGGGGQGSNSWQLTQVGNSFVEITKKLTSRINFIPYYAHLQAIVLSEEVAKEGLEGVLDFFMREPSMRRRTDLFVCSGEAKRILDVVPKIEDFSSIYLGKLPDNSAVSSEIARRANLGEVMVNMHNHRDFLLPRVKAVKDEIQNSGAAIFKNDKMVGWIDSIELETCQFIRNEYTSGVITANCPLRSESIIAINIKRSKTKLAPVIDGNNVSFDIKISCIGELIEMIGMENYLNIDDAYLDKASEAFENRIEQICTDTVKSIQKNYGADVFNFEKILSAKEPAYWEANKDKWHDIFPEVKVDIEADVKITNVGNRR